MPKQDGAGGISNQAYYQQDGKRAYEGRARTATRYLYQTTHHRKSTKLDREVKLTNIPMDSPAKNRPASIISLLTAAVCRTPPRRKMIAPTKTGRR
jgi:hypothetical protein